MPIAADKIAIARNSALVGLALTILKLTVGLLAGSLALTSEGIHGAIDVLATSATWLTVRASDAPADAQHNYGHGKLESLSAFGQSIVLVLTAFGIVYEAINRLLYPVAVLRPQHLWWAVGTIVLVMVVDFSRTLALRRAAIKYNSAALGADAAHFGTELLSSFLVLTGVLIAAIWNDHSVWAARADTLAAIGVALVMCYVAIHLARTSTDVLIDRAPEGLEATLQDIVRRVPGVRDVPRIRARLSGSNTFLDMTITVDPSLGIDGGHLIASSVELAVTEKIPNLDVLVHVEPADPVADQADEIRLLATGMNLNLHALRVREIQGRVYVSFHVELDPKMVLAEAHALVTKLEERIRLRLPAVAEIDSHLEPRGAHGE